MLNSALNRRVPDPVYDIIGKVSAKAAGLLDIGLTIVSGNTMNLAKDLASGEVTPLAKNILGDTSERIGKGLAEKIRD